MALSFRQVDANQRNTAAIQQQKSRNINCQNYLTQRLRVCAYCRVSTEEEQQQSSFQTQVSFYTKYINDNPNWELVDVYADDGESGSQIHWRKGFSKMVEDGLAGKFDLVITKSFSRFARNTVDCLETIRKFREAGIDIYFEDKSLHTLEETGELMLTIYSAFAQEELRNISSNVAWGYEKKFARGEAIISPRLLGYNVSVGVVTINESEARVVRLIYQLFLEGYTYIKIKHELENRGILTKVFKPAQKKYRSSTKQLKRKASMGGSKTWNVSTIKSILRNEKYTGNALMQKTFCVDYLTKVRKKNTGERKQFYIENSHPAIIPLEIFDLVQEEIHRREMLAAENKQKENKSSFKVTAERNNNYSAKYHLSNILFCKECGSPFRRYTWAARRKTKIVWMCKIRKKKGGRELCPNSPSIEESVLHKAIINVISDSVAMPTDQTNSFISENLKYNLEELDNLKAELAKKQSIYQKIEDEKENHQEKNLTDIEVKELEAKKESCINEISKLELEISKYKFLCQQITEISGQVNSIGLNTHEYSDDLARALIDKINVTKNAELEIRFKSGLMRKVEVETVGG